MSPDMFILDVINPQSIVVINLDRRPDRWAAMQQAWHPEVVQRFVRFVAVDGRLLAPHDYDASLYQVANNVSFEKATAEVACRQSWIEAVKQFGPALYFEDDARAGDPWPYGLPPDSADLVLLGGFLWRKTLQPGWRSAWQGASAGHAIWIRNEQAVEALLQAWQSDEGRFQPPDVSWSTALIQSHAVIAVPQMVPQADLGTDIQMGRIFHPDESIPFDPWCSLEGGARRVQKSSSWKEFGIYNPAIFSIAPSK